MLYVALVASDNLNSYCYFSGKCEIVLTFICYLVEMFYIFVLISLYRSTALFIIPYSIHCIRSEKTRFSLVESLRRLIHVKITWHARLTLTQTRGVGLSNEPKMKAVRPTVRPQRIWLTFVTHMHTHTSHTQTHTHTHTHTYIRTYIRWHHHIQLS